MSSPLELELKRVFARTLVDSASESGYTSMRRFRTTMAEASDAPVVPGRDGGSPNLPDVQPILLAVAHATVSNRDLQSLLHELAGLLQRFGPFDRVAIVLHDAERDLMQLHTLAALDTPRVTHLELPSRNHLPASPGGRNNPLSFRASSARLDFGK